MGEPCRQQAMLMFPLCAVGVVGGKGRLGENIESRKEPECLIEIEVADIAATFLVQQLQGEQAEQGAGSRYHLLAGITRLRDELVKLQPRQQREKQEQTGYT